MNEKKYADYSVADFLQDDDFLRWVSHAQPADDVFWTAFLMDHPEQQETLEKARALASDLGRLSLQAGLRAEEKEDMLEQMQARIRESRPSTGLQLASRRRSRNWSAMAIAATVLLLILAGWWMLSGPALVTVTTAYGERESVTLPDGSRVELNANSSLQYAANWEDDEDRAVWLEGEAFFEVEKKVQTGQKFRVITEDLTVEVLGTVFNVNSRHEETEVFLEEGSINLEFEGLSDALLLEPGETITYSEKKRQIPEKRKVQAQLHTAWTDGFLFFSGTPLREVLEKVEDIYGVSFELADTSNYSRLMNTAVPIDNLQDAITLIGTTLTLDFQEVDDHHFLIGGQSE